MLSFAEENYLKIIYHLGEEHEQAVTTNAIASEISTSAASVSDMLKKLAAKKLIHYQKYKGVKLTDQGSQKALQIIRKHRLWETFLVEKLDFNWDQVHEVAEQLEHIQSSLLISRLDELLAFPKYDPHGDPIPNAEGKMELKSSTALSECPEKHSGHIVLVKDHSPSFLQYLQRIGAHIGTRVTVMDKLDFDGSLQIQLATKNPVFISREMAENIWID